MHVRPAATAAAGAPRIAWLSADHATAAAIGPIAANGFTHLLLDRADGSAAARARAAGMLPLTDIDLYRIPVSDAPGTPFAPPTGEALRDPRRIVDPRVATPPLTPGDDAAALGSWW